MEYSKKLLKKYSWLLIFNLIVSFFLALVSRGFNSRFFDFIPVFLIIYVALPFISGIILVLIQNRNRSYEYLPVLLVGAVLNNAFTETVAIIGEHFAHFQLYRYFFNYYDFLGFYLPLVFLSLIGGLFGLVIRGASEQFKKCPNLIIASRKIFGSVFVGISALVGLVSLVVFLVLFFNPSSSWLNMIMVDFRLIDLLGILFYYLLLISVLLIILIPLIFLANWGLKPLLGKKFINKKIALRLIIYLVVFLTIFLLLAIYIGSEFNVKTAEMKADIRENHINIKDFKNIYISPYVEFDDIIIKQGNDFDIIVKGSEYDRIGLDFKKNGDTLNIKRSELETFFNTNTWTVENRNILFPAGTKHLTIEITIPDLEKIENEGANMVLENLEVDNLEIKLTHRFNNIKGSIKAGALKLDVGGGIINLTGSADNLVINSGDCWIEMDKFIAERAEIRAVNTSRLNVYVVDNMEVLSGKNSGIINYYDELNNN
jgi:hypothetical protein